MLRLLRNTRPRLLLLTLVAGLLTGLLNAAHAQLAWESTRQEVAAKPGDTQAAIRFPFVNRGSEPVTIKKVRSSCGCTTVELAKKTYQPGEKGEIIALFDFGNRTGAQSKRVIVQTSDKRKETLLFTVHIP